VTYAERSVEEFLAAVASSRVAPSAGATAALTGAMAASLCEMVCHHTSDPSERLAAARSELRDHRRLLLALADEDAAAVDEVQTAFDATSDDAHEQAALGSATEIPVRIAEVARDVAECAVVVAAEGTRNARTDAVVGALIARAAVASAAAIVRENVELIEDDEYGREARRRIEAAETDATTAVTSVTDR
jgi:formiminotetrahydrofolate cyclodeaminase